MATIFLIILCISAVTATCHIKSDIQNNRAANFVGSFSKNLDFLNYVFSYDNINRYKYSAENVPDAHLIALGRIANTYSMLRGEFVTWCSYVDKVFIDPNNAAHKEVTNLPEYDPRQGPFLFALMTSKSSTILREMKELLQPMVANGRSNGQVRSKRGSNRSEKVFKDNRETPFSDDVTTALSIIDHLLNKINNNLTINALNASQMKCECSAVLSYAAQISETINSPPGEPASGNATTAQVLRTPKPSEDDLLERQSESCFRQSNFQQNIPSVPSCDAYFSKSSLNLLNKFYSEVDTVSSFLNQINSSRLLSECREYLTNFIKNEYLSWGYEAPRMNDTQMLHISVRLDKEKSFQVQVVN